ncbi:N-alpha-acetyltransferase 30 [Drosophila pseudoobscura]|uniref:N-alpha-acetyltransferase 30 n=1 Tax=Drosophila pseudoobscura pseudoobscura TaxID=46245 RepID=A0A6I8WAB9_DROPS|nr:N-alpha-acetyltransferase 30 [Drosophila pseudoobscura]
MIPAPIGVEGPGGSPLSEQKAATAPRHGPKMDPSPSVPAPKGKRVAAPPAPPATPAPRPVIRYSRFRDEAELAHLQRLIDGTLSEPYTLYTYRYFVYNWPELCFFARHKERYVGVVVGKVEAYDMGMFQGYIAMLAVDPEYRHQHIGRTLVCKAVAAMVDEDVDVVILETECSNAAALALYESLGFIREQRLFKYYLNGGDAFRLKLGLKADVMEPPSPDYHTEEC